jgi:hypothetical protein
VTLLIAAALEAGGDALMRVGQHKNLPSGRLLFFVLAAAVLFAYGWTVNAPPWDFGKLIGIYVVFFFLIAQLISWLEVSSSPGRRCKTLIAPIYRGAEMSAGR